MNVPNFQLHPAAIRLLEKRPPTGKTNEDANKHMQRFLTMSTTLKIKGNIEERNKLRRFPFTLAKDVEEWFHSLSTNSITTWEDMKTIFLNGYFLASVFLRKQYKFINLKQKEDESLRDVYKMF